VGSALQASKHVTCVVQVALQVETGGVSLQQQLQAFAEALEGQLLVLLPVLA
jgi:hypothetical protein